MKKKKVKLPKNWGKLSKENEAYLRGFNDGWISCQGWVEGKKLVKKK